MIDGAPGTAALARVRESVPDARLVVVTHPAAECDVGEALTELKAHPGVEVLVAQTFGAVVRALHGARVLICSRGSWSGFPIKSLNYLASGIATVHARGSAYPIEDVRTAEDLPKLPLLDKSEIRKSPDAFLATDPKALHVLYTSGTTGTPLKLYRSTETYRSWYACFERRATNPPAIPETLVESELRELGVLP